MRSINSILPLFEYIVPKTVDKHTAPVITKTPLYYGDDWIYNMLP